MNYNTILNFTMIALRAIVSQLDPNSPAATLASKTLDLISIAIRYAGLSPSPLFATMPLAAFSGRELPAQPWTPESLLKWAETQKFATPPDAAHASTDSQA